MFDLISEIFTWISFWILLGIISVLIFSAIVKSNKKKVVLRKKSLNPISWSQLKYRGIPKEM